MTADRLVPGQVLDLPAGQADGSHATTGVLLRTKNAEVVQLVVPAGKSIPEHTAPGELVVQCLRGRARMEAMGKSHELVQGQMLYLPRRQPHAVHAIEDAILLLIIVLVDRCNPGDVQEASEESFPASDAPAWTGVTGS